MPDTARHLILGGAQGVSDTAASSWLLEFAEVASTAAYPYIGVGLDGELRDLATVDAFTPTWSVGAPLNAWPDLSNESNFAIWIRPETNIQFSTPSALYANSAQSALTATLSLVDQIAESFPGAPIVLEEDWADPTPFLLDGVMTKATRNVYFEFILTTYHQWFETLLEAVQSARPGLDISLISTASTLANLTTTVGFADLAMVLMPENPIDGAEARALLSGAVAFSSSFTEPIPTAPPLVEEAVPDLADLFPDLSAAISIAILGDLELNPDSGTIDLSTIHVIGTENADAVVLGEAMETIDLGAGLDSVIINATRDTSTVQFDSDGRVYVALPGDSTPASLTNIERLVFQDGTLAFDTNGVAGQVYRLYQASFDRTPDAEGLGFWIDVLDTGETSLLQAAEYFMQSEEFGAAYGTPEEVTDVLFLTLLYVNALDRQPDADGFTFWREQQEQGLTRAEMMLYFSESPENIAQVAPAVDDGIWFI